MGQSLRFALLLMLFAVVYPNSDARDLEQCKSSIKQWASSALHSDTKNSHILKDLLFFLHVPRTGGRTYFHCFLKKLYSSDLECPRSYDKLRFDPRKPDCRLLATHDDYSMMSKLPREQTSVVTILRDPIERVFSTYEFSVEVAARFLVHPNLTSVLKMSNRIRSKNGGISTLDIWPWKYLVPWMREDLFSRRDARRRRGPPHLYGNDSYDMEEIVMPLHDYVNHPIALELVHNGATFQVRIFQYNGGHSREIYHTKRMQRVFCVKFSCDASYVISGSDDTNLRLWKAKASEQLGVILPRERKKHEYMEAVKNRYKHLPEVKRILRHRHLPKPIYKAGLLRRTMLNAEKRKEDRRRAHSAPGSIPRKSLRKSRIIKDIE